MAAETAKQFEALETQAQILMSHFTKAGYEAVAPAIIQPADVFLDVVGEALRARTYVFTDPDGDELCLRPDLTVPTCRLHLERNGHGKVPAKYCYNGPAFRFQPQGADRTHPREFRQAGIESFGDPDREAADSATMTHVVDALGAAGLTDAELTVGDLGLFRALLASLEMPERWRQRLMHRFWRPQCFHDELQRLKSGMSDGLGKKPHELIVSLMDSGEAEAERRVAAYLESQGIEMVGTRTLGEIAERLRWIAADGKTDPLPASTVEEIESYLRVRGPAADAWKTLAGYAKGRPGMAQALEAYQSRLKLLEDLEGAVARMEFAAEFGRSLEYYTGFVFEVVSSRLGPLSPVAGGGRYDGVLKAAGAPFDVPAVGGAIHTERLLDAIAGDTP
jgi:ATP phosphoribosyltransferase regulatory subunit